MDDARALAATPEQIKQMVDRFLSWPLPADFNPDGGITFTPEYQNPVGPARHEPTGTNLLTAAQATAMVENMLAAIDRLAAPEGVGLTLETNDSDRSAWAEVAPALVRDHNRLTAALAAKEYELKRFHEARANAPDYEVLWAEQAERAEAAEHALADATKRIEERENTIRGVQTWLIGLTHAEWKVPGLAAVLESISYALLTPANEGKTDG